MSSSTARLRARRTWTTLGYMPSGSCSSFCTSVSTPSFDRSAPGTCRENLDLSSSTEKRDRDRRIASAGAATVGSSSESSPSSAVSLSAGHSVG